MIGIHDYVDYMSTGLNIIFASRNGLLDGNLDIDAEKLVIFASRNKIYKHG